MINKFIEGKLFLYSETGTEGGYLSIQDCKFITLNSPTFGIGNNCKVWDKANLNRQGLTSKAEILIENNWQEFPDPIYKDKDYEISSLFCGEQKGDISADLRLAKKYNFKIKYSAERLDEVYGQGGWRIDNELPYVILKDGTHLHFGSTPKTIPIRPYGISKGGTTRVEVRWSDGIAETKTSDELLIENWDYKGLHILKNKDILIVEDFATKDVICQGQIDLIPLKIFSQTLKGHFDQAKQTCEESCNWEIFFSENYYAELLRP